ncbi:MAG: exported protein of unknown function [Candidatus Saccharibacteria bacterium]|jgi:hypothetical protein|nr:exported protein of unknown function [Candidatus Saccharibacteria bacterium]
MSKRLAGWAGLFLMGAYCVICTTSVAYANVPQSNSYRFDESTVGSGGLIQSNSANFQATNASGDLAVGNSASGNFQVDSGSKTTNDPTLAFAINTADANFGSFSASTPTVATATFSVANYTAYGYVVQLAGSPPTNGTHVIDPLTTASTSQTGIEQFGVNVVANTLPVSVGANPNNGQFGFGEAAPNYNTSNSYRYVSGDTIAKAPKSSGLTTYTLSYLVNVDSLTPGGQYTSDQTIVVTGTY